MTAQEGGAGRPPFFICARARRDRMRSDGYPSGHEKIERTGRTRKSPRGGAGGWYRKLTEAIEYRCECGHRGWTTHPDVLCCPLDHLTPEDVGNGSDCPVHPEKQQYASKADAREFAPAARCAQYLCDYCGCWHNGGTTPRSNRKREERTR